MTLFLIGVFCAAALGTFVGVAVTVFVSLVFIGKALGEP